MVKIHNTPEERNKGLDRKHKGLDNNIVDESLILEMITPDNKVKTSSLNIRLEKSIVNQIEEYSKEHNTTKTEVIKDILINHYANKKINKGTFKLKEPVTLIIPHSKELLTEYIENEVNIITTVKGNNNNEINALDPQQSLYNLKGTYSLETITEANNLLDSYDEFGGYYSYNMDTEQQYYEMFIFHKTELIDEDDFTDFPFVCHRGLMYCNIKNEDVITAVLIDLICMGNELVRAVIIDKERALELARITNNYELISFIHQIDNYVTISELVRYDMTNQELIKENLELKQVIKEIHNDYDNLKFEYDSILESLKSDFNDRQDNDVFKYTEALEIENKKLKDKIRKYEEKDITRSKQLMEIEALIQEYNNIK